MTTNGSTRQLSVEQLTVFLTDAATVTQWNALAGGNPFLSWEWLECWWRHYCTAESSERYELCILLLRDAAGNLVGGVPWYAEHSALGRRVVRFLGSGEVCSDYLTILCEPQHQEAVVKSLTRWLMRKQPARWESLELDGIMQDDCAIGTLADCLVQRGCSASRGDMESCWRISLPSSWEDYLLKLSKSRRTKVRQLHRKYIDTGIVTSHRVTTEETLRKAFDALCKLHQARRNSLGQSGCFASQKFTAFHHETTSRLLHSGNLAMHWLTVDNEPIAVEYSIATGATVYFYQSGIAPEMAEIRPGWLALTNAIREAIAEGYETFDFLRGDEPYKASLGAIPQKMATLNISNSHLGAQARRLVRQSAAYAKNLLKNVWQPSLNG